MAAQCAAEQRLANKGDSFKCMRTCAILTATLLAPVATPAPTAAAVSEPGAEVVAAVATTAAAAGAAAVAPSATVLPVLGMRSALGARQLACFCLLDQLCLKALEHLCELALLLCYVGLRMSGRCRVICGQSFRMLAAFEAAN